MGSKVDLSVRPEGGWTPENMKAYREEWWRQEMARPKADWEDVEDPEGRIKKGQRVRWRNAEWGKADMEVISLSAPGGLYKRPPREDDSPSLVRLAQKYGDGFVPCEGDEPGAIYCPENLNVKVRYLEDDAPSSAKAASLVVVEDFVEGGRAFAGRV